MMKKMKNEKRISGLVHIRKRESEKGARTEWEWTKIMTMKNMQEISRSSV